MKKWRKTLRGGGVAAVLALWAVAGQADIRLRMETILGDIDVRMDEAAAPRTVRNFLNYVEDGDYERVIVHRSVPGFVIQAGGYRLSGDTLEQVPQDPPVANEFSRSNVRGTLAMAKLGNDPDSATSQWFFNLADNSTNLDNQNGGFTVFGDVISGMEVVDAIAGLQRVNGGGSFAELPVLDSYTGGVPQPDDYVVINRIRFISPRLQVSPVIQFDPVPVGDSAQRSVLLRNIGLEDLVLGQISSQDGLAAPFSVVSDACSGRTLASGESCELGILFSAAVEGEHSDSFDIPSNDPVDQVRYVALKGKGVPPVTPYLVVTPEEGGLDLGRVALGETAQATVELTNWGSVALEIRNQILEGVDGGDFSVAGSCPALGYGESCQLVVTVSPSSEGRKAAVLRLETNDPARSVMRFDLRADTFVRKPDIYVMRELFIGEVAIEVHHFSDVLVGGEKTARFTVANWGDAELVVDRMALRGDAAAEYKITHTCTRIEPEGRCYIDVVFRPSVEGERSAVLEIFSNDPDSPKTEVDLLGTGRLNWERISLRRPTGDLFRMIAPPGSRLRGVVVDDEAPAEDVPAGVRFDQGFVKFTLELAPGTNATAIAIVLPEGVTPTTYYKYGRTPDNAEPHWYEFMWDGFTGAVIDGNIVTLYFLDGERGDDDLVRNGVIRDPGAPGFSVMATEAGVAMPITESDSRGGGCLLASRVGKDGWPVEWLAILVFLAWLGLCRRAE